jgi:hypothetical protein
MFNRTEFDCHCDSIATPEIYNDIEWSAHGDLCGSDHFPTIINMDSNITNQTRRPRWLLKTANWESFRETVGKKTMEINTKAVSRNMTKAISETIKKGSDKVPWWNID